MTGWSPKPEAVHCVRSRNRLRTLARLVLVGFPLALAEAAAQTPESAARSPLADGTYSISFGFDGGSSAQAGVWYAFGRTNMGFLGTLDWARASRNDGSEVESSTDLALGPRAKWYVTANRPVTPFWLGGIDLVVERRSGPGEESTNRRGFALLAGLGADWFPVDRLSVGGWTGLDLRFVSESGTGTSVTRLRTLTSGLAVHLYF